MWSPTIRHLLVSLALVVAALPGCRLFTREVACVRDRDCPLDAGMPYCTSFNDDAGTCTDDESFRGDFPEDDAGSDVVLDAGSLDAGASDAGS